MTTSGRAGSIFQYAFIFLILFFTVLRLVPIFNLYYLMDESADVHILQHTLGTFFYFFPTALYADQARLPHLVSSPIVFLFRDNPLVPLRLLFFGFHLLYLWVSYKLVFSVTRSVNASRIYILLLLTSCYVGALSIFSMTTCGWLYLLFHILCLYSFWSSFSEQKRSSVFPGHILLGGLLGACIASSLFGLFLLPALILFHLLSAKKTLVNSVRPGVMILCAVLFLSGIVLMQLLPILLFTKTLIAMALSLFYLSAIFFMGRRERLGTSQPVQTGLFLLWLSIVLTAASVSLILSPIYLNMGNVEKVLHAIHQFRQGEFLKFHRPFDTLRIIILKFGLVSGLAVLVPFFYFVHNYKGSWKGEFYFLLVCVFLAHYTMIERSVFVTAGYPMAVFPFLYLFFVAFWEVGERHSKKIKTVAVLLILLVIADNQARYFRWFPYAHFDGAQYGKEHYGPINRAGMVSTDAWPVIADFLKVLDDKGEAPATVLLGTPGIPKGGLNDFSISILEQALKERGVQKIRIVGSSNNADMVLLSTTYFPRSDGYMKNFNYEKIRSIAIQGVEMFTIWKFKGQRSP